MAEDQNRPGEKLQTIMEEDGQLKKKVGEADTDEA
jgi:hypothetical protein